MDSGAGIVGIEDSDGDYSGQEGCMIGGVDGGQVQRSLQENRFNTIGYKRSSGGSL